MATSKYVEIQVLFLHEDPRGARLLLQRDYKEAVPLSEASPHVLVEGMRTALQTILESLEADLAAVDLTGE